MARATQPPVFRGSRGGPIPGVTPNPSAPKAPPAPPAGKPVKTSGLVNPPGGSITQVHHKLLTPEAVRNVQTFLRGKGYHLNVDGIAGPQTKAAIRDYFQPGKNGGFGDLMQAILGTDHLKPGARDASGFNTHFGVGHSPVYVQPDAKGNPPKGTPGAVPDPNAGGVISNPLAALTATLIARANKGLGEHIPQSYALDAAAPFTAAASADQHQIDQAPNAKAQALHDIGNWYGQVVKALSTAKTRDKSISDAGAQSVDAATQAIVGSLGGSAMGGSGVVSSVGEGGANTIRALGASQQQLAEDLGPILDLAKSGALSATGAKFDQQLIALKDQLAKDQGSATAAKSDALSKIIEANNGVDQQNFSNMAGILNTLSALQSAGYRAKSAAILNATRLKKLETDPNSFAAASAKEKAAVAQQISQTVGQLMQQNKIDWPTALQTARNIVRTNGWSALNPEVVQQIIQPALNIAGIHFQNPATLYQP